MPRREVTDSNDPPLEVSHEIYGDRKDVILLIKAFDDENPLVQRSVALGSLGDSRAVETLKVLIDDAHSENSLRSQNAVLALIAIGRNDVVDELVGILGKKGNVEMANAFMDCGNESLVEAGRNWAKMHEDEFKRKDNSPIVEWGGMKPGLSAFLI
jgi:HEAT repeat protein